MTHTAPFLSQRIFLTGHNLQLGADVALDRFFMLRSRCTTPHKGTYQSRHRHGGARVENYIGMARGGPEGGGNRCTYPEVCFAAYPLKSECYSPLPPSVPCVNTAPIIHRSLHRA